MRDPRTPRARRRAGFTLIELLVALTLGALVVAAIFTISGGSARHFTEQQRVAVTQRSVRLAMDRLRRDIARAGFTHVPRTDAAGVQLCPIPALSEQLPAIRLFNDDSAGNGALPNRTLNGVSADRLQLRGNYETGFEYYASEISTNTLRLQTVNSAFRRSFFSPNGGTPTVDATHFTSVFRAGRRLHIVTPLQRHWFVTITGSTIDSLGINQISFSPALPAETLCLPSRANSAARVSPISWIEYAIEADPGTSNLAPGTANITGPNARLVRRELDAMDASGATVLSQRVVLEYAVDFNVQFVVDSNAPATPVNLVLQDGAASAATSAGTPWQIRSVITSIAARTPEQDTRFGWPAEWVGGRPTTAPLSRFRVFSTRPGAARVRQLTTEVLTPNMVIQ